ncbi:PorV/PorQ family protein [candidate division KSB1 bacterium]|nr:PorV/PorQ family protein [candidate division KSB1 bacterium]RQW00181.1 MAG: PorV/PorQ family protein [candidate division KSB1 bacterium]
MKIVLSIVAFLLMFTFGLFAAGETGLAVLKVGVGARAAAMGEAFAALADDASGIYWNPAGSACIKKRQAHFTHNSWLQGINHNVASLIFPSKIGTFGLGLLLNNIDGFERRTFASEEPAGTFSAHDFSVALHYARQLTTAFSIGANIKYVNEKIYVEDASGYLIDIGLRYRAPFEGLYVGGAVQNLGFTNKMATEKIRLPQTVRMGGVYHMPSDLKVKVLVAIDYVQVIEESSHINLGTEVRPVDAISLRAGYQTGFEEKGMSAGFGLHVSRFDIDYAYVPFGRDLGDSHRFSLTTSF